MIPLIPTLALALVSLTCSAFVILRTVLSVLSPRTLSRRLYPVSNLSSYQAAHFPLKHYLQQLHYQPPSSRALPPADKSYIWLALCDLLVLSVFLWEAFTQWSSSSSSTHSTTPGIGTTSRLWLALTLRQTCFLIVSALILIHVRMRRSVSFGIAHWLLWVPLVFLATVSTAVAGIFAASTTSPGLIFRVGYITYSSAIAVLNTIMFGCLVGTLIIIRRSIENFHKAQGFQPSNDSRAADIDVIREGSAWISSTMSSRATNISPSSARTRHTSQNATPSPKFPFWPPPGAHPYASLPQTPSPRRDDAAHYKDFATEPFRRRAQSLRAAALTLSSGNSWITSSLGTHPTLSAWSYPTTLSSRQVTGSGVPSTPTRDRSPVSPLPLAVTITTVPSQTEKGQPGPSSSGTAPASPVIEISVLRILAWLAGVWVPLVKFPCLICERMLKLLILVTCLALHHPLRQLESTEQQPNCVHPTRRQRDDLLPDPSAKLALAPPHSTPTPKQPLRRTTQPTPSRTTLLRVTQSLRPSERRR